MRTTAGAIELYRDWQDALARYGDTDLATELFRSGPPPGKRKTGVTSGLISQSRSCGHALQAGRDAIA
jgi:hypothetical protein